MRLSDPAKLLADRANHPRRSPQRGLRRAKGRQEGLGSIGLANANQANLAAQVPLDSVEPQ